MSFFPHYTIRFFLFKVYSLCFALILKVTQANWQVIEKFFFKVTSMIEKYVKEHSMKYLPEALLLRDSQG